MVNSERVRFIGLAVAIFALATAGIFFILSFSPKYNYCVGHLGQYATDQYNSQGKAIFGPAIPNPGPIDLFFYCGGIYANANAGGITAGATVMLMILTGLLAYLARLQFKTSRTQLSAFVSVEDMRPFYEIDPTASQPTDPTLPRNVAGWAFRPVWRNSGETQTRNMVTHADCELRDRPLPPHYPFPDNHSQNARMLLGPKSLATGGSPRTFTVPEMLEVQAGTKFLYLWGWIRYENVFQRRRSHLTRYCIQVTVISDPSKSNAVFSYPIPNEGNCSDDECIKMGLR